MIRSLVVRVLSVVSMTEKIFMKCSHRGDNDVVFRQLVFISCEAFLSLNPLTQTLSDNLISHLQHKNNQYLEHHGTF